MRIIIGTDLLHCYLTHSDYLEGISILFRWINAIGAKKVIDTSSVAILTHLVPMKRFDDLKGFTLLKEVPKKSVEIIFAEKQDKNSRISHQKKQVISKAELAQLNLIEQNLADLMITENTETHRIADQLGLDDRVYTIEEFIEKCVCENRDKDQLKGEIVKVCKFKELSIKDPFFLSFIDDYSEFKNWKKRKENDDVYMSEAQDGSIRALLKLKFEGTDEDYSGFTPRFRIARRLKISSLKIKYSGSKLIERFLRIIFDNALKYEVDEVYFTIFRNNEEKRHLIKIVEKWGFEYWGTNLRKELIYVRKMDRKLTGILRNDFPFIDAKHDIYLVPVYKTYGDELLPSTDVRFNKSDVEPYRAAIRKVLILHDKADYLKEGDIILFYRRTSTIEDRGIFAAGVIEKFFSSIKEREKFISRCRKRSNLNSERLTECWNVNYQDITLVDFLYSYSFGQDIIQDSQLMEVGIETARLSSQHCYPIKKEQFKQLIEGSGLEKLIIK